MFYGLSLKTNDLGASPYLTFLISAIVEILAYLIIQCALDKTGRKIPYIIFLTFSGLSCLSIPLSNNLYYQISAAMFGKLCTSGSYGIIYIYTAEIFPTSIRSSGIVCFFFKLKLK
jgi:MFS transporter, OCT family, solute carrier family 22 (organic cation transporter), member 4/5